MLLTSIVLNQTLTCQGTDTPLRLIATVRGYMTAWRLGQEKLFFNGFPEHCQDDLR
jgi:hypothetical protein